MIILKTPKGWTGPKEVEGKKVEGSFRAHQVPISITRDNPENLKIILPIFQIICNIRK